MKNVMMFAAALLSAAVLAAPAWAGGPKTLPPAFGKELVPDEPSQERAEERAAEMQEEQEGAPSKPKKAPPPRYGRKQKLHIHLDGDEDGGGEDLDEGGLAD